MAKEHGAETKGVVNGLIGSVWNGQDLGPSRRSILPTSSTIPFLKAPTRGIEGLKASIGMFLAAFPNVRIEVCEQLSEEDRAASHLIFRGRHEGEFMGVSSSGREVEMIGVRIDRVRNGGVSEHWASFDLAGSMQQISS